MLVRARPDRPVFFGLLALATAAALYLGIGARGDLGFILVFRGNRLLALVTVAVAVGVSTVVFQTLSNNRILTPSIMGFDALYLLLQTSLVFGLSGLGFAQLDPYWKFASEIALMLGASLLLFGTLLRNSQDLSRMILTGIIFGVLFRSLTGLLNRMIDPSEFAIVQSASFARFNAVNQELTWVSGMLTFGVCAWLVSRHRLLDVIALGRAAAINLGVDHDRETRRLLGLVAVLVSVSTALVGPVVFFGLLAAALTHQIAGTWRHAVLLPLSGLVSATILVGSQTLFERVLKLQTSVSVVIEVLGGIAFLYLILRRTRR